MRRTLASLISILVILSASPAVAVATGESRTGLDVCTKESADRFGGTKVFARDKGKGGGRVLCPVVDDVLVDDADDMFAFGVRSDGNLDRRKKKLPKTGDIWNGFDRNIESFKLRAAAGCATAIILSNSKGKTLMSRELGNDGGKAINKRYEVSRKKDNKTTRVTVGVACPVATSASFPLYATGAIGCEGAAEKINEVGTAYLGVENGRLAWAVKLDGAAKNWSYKVEVQRDDGDCQEVMGTFRGFRTNGAGDGEFGGILDLPAGTYQLNLDVVSTDGPPPFPGNREIGGFGYVEVIIS